MNIYIWDAGIIIGYVIYPGEKFKEITNKIDPLSPNCIRFVHDKAIHCENHIPSNSNHEVKSRLQKNYSTFTALVSLIKTGKLVPNMFIDTSRLLKLQKKLNGIQKNEAIKGLIEIQSVIQSRNIQVRKLCNLKIYNGRIEKIHENSLETILSKKGDLLNYSSAIHFHNKEGKCIFITTDYKDFNNLNLNKCNIPYTTPPIEFIKDYC